MTDTRDVDDSRVLHQWASKCRLRIVPDSRGAYLTVVDASLDQPIALFTTERETLAFLKGYFIALPPGGR